MCGTTFEGGPRAWYCPECRAIRRHQSDIKHKRQGTKRPLGSIDHCLKCGKEYIVNSARQKYCPDCAYEAVREIDRMQGRGNLARAVRKYGQSYKEQIKKEKIKAWHANKTAKICPICGKSFMPAYNYKRSTCSDICQKNYVRYAAALSHYKSGKIKTEPILNDYKVGGRLYHQSKEKN